MWLLFEPRTVMPGVTEENRAAATDFSRERTVRRYNKMLNELISFGVAYSLRDPELHALGTAVGVDAVFRLGSDTAFSRRSRG